MINRWRSRSGSSERRGWRRRGCGHWGGQLRLRKPYTEGETAALVIIAREVQQHGVSDLPIGRIAPAAVQLIRVSPLLIEASVQGTPVCRGNPTRWFLPGDGASKPPPGIYTNMMTES